MANITLCSSACTTGQVCKSNCAIYNGGVICTRALHSYLLSPSVVLFACTDPGKPRASSDLVQRFDRPKQLTDDLHEAVWFSTRPRSKTIGFLERGGIGSLRSSQHEIAGVTGDCEPRALQNNYRYRRASVADSTNCTENNFWSVTSDHPTVSRGRSAFIRVPATKGSLCVPGSSSTTVKYHAKLPSFRAIVRHLQEDSQRRRLSELSAEGQSTERVPSMLFASSDTMTTWARTPSSGVKDELNARRGTRSVGFDTSDSIARSTDSLYHKLARERFKRSFTRLATRLNTSVPCGQPEETETDVSACCYCINWQSKQKLLFPSLLCFEKTR